MAFYLLNTVVTLKDNFSFDEFPDTSGPFSTDIAGHSDKEFLLVTYFDFQQRVKYIFLLVLRNITSMSIFCGGLEVTYQVLKLVRSYCDAPDCEPNSHFQ